MEYYRRELSPRVRHYPLRPSCRSPVIHRGDLNLQVRVNGFSARTAVIARFHGARIVARLPFAVVAPVSDNNVTRYCVSIFCRKLLYFANVKDEHLYRC